MHSPDEDLAAYIQSNYSFTPIDVDRATPASVAAAYGFTIDEVDAITAPDPAGALRSLAETWGLLGGIFVGNLRIRKWLHTKGTRPGRTPAKLLQSENGLLEFTQLVGRIAYGVYR